MSLSPHSSSLFPYTTLFRSRLTWQATPKNKFAVTYDMQDINGNWPFGGCNCVRVGSSTTSVEANTARRFPLQRSLQADWTSPDRKSTRLNSSHTVISYAVFC